MLSLLYQNNKTKKLSTIKEKKCIVEIGFVGNTLIMIQINHIIAIIILALIKWAVIRLYGLKVGLVVEKVGDQIQTIRKHKMNLIIEGVNMDSIMEFPLKNSNSYA